MTSFAWSNNPIIDTEISLTDHSMIDLMDFDFNSITQQTTDTTSTGDVSNTTGTSTTTSDGGGNNTGTSSNTCPEPYSDQPELSFSANTESFTFPLTELCPDSLE